MDCSALLCFHPLSSGGARIFGFAEYLAALALIVVAWTIADRRYTFHLETARWPVRRIAFYVVGAVGGLTLLTDVWRASEWPVPTGEVLTPVTWQALLGGAFLAAFVMWIATAFLYPPRFNERNARKFIGVAFRTVSVGDDSDLALLGEALGPSAKAIVKMAAERRSKTGELTRRNKLAGELLAVLADPIFCRVAVKSAPRTLYELFKQLRESPQASWAMEELARNVLDAAVNNTDSFLHRETAQWNSGLAARSQVVSRAIFGEIRTLEAIRLMFSKHEAYGWNHRQWDAYLRAAGHAFSSFAKDTRFRSQTIIDILSTMEAGTDQLRRLNATTEITHADEREIAESILQFVQSAAEMLASDPTCLDRWSQDEFSPLQKLSKLAAKVLLDAAAVTSPSNTSWWIQYNDAWHGVFGKTHDGGEVVMAEIRERVARMVWSQIKELEFHPNFVGGRLLGYCLNISWVVGDGRKARTNESKAERALLWLARRWAKRNFDWLYKYDRNVATSGLSDLVTYQPKRLASSHVGANRRKAEADIQHVGGRPVAPGGP